MSHHVARLTPRPPDRQVPLRPRLGLRSGAGGAARAPGHLRQPGRVLRDAGPASPAVGDLAGGGRRRGAARRCRPARRPGRPSATASTRCRSTSSTSSSTRRWSPPAPAYAAYAAASFPAGRAIVDGLVDLTHRLHARSGVRARRRPPSPRRSPTSSGSGAASARTSPICRSPASARSACRRATSAATSKRRRRPTSRAWSAPTPRTPGSRSTCPAPAGSTPTRPTTRPRRSPRHAGVGPRLRATSARSAASSSAAASSGRGSRSTSCGAVEHRARLETPKTPTPNSQANSNGPTHQRAESLRLLGPRNAGTGRSRRLAIGAWEVGN